MSRPSWIGYTLGGRYKIESLLGQGGMSAVYRAQDPNLRRTVAVKLIHSHLSSDPEFVRRFEAEAAAVAQLRHPNIVQVYDFNHDDDVYYMVMEYLPGDSLQTRLKELSTAGSRYTLPETADIIAKVAEAVAYAHERGTIHRDLKPANVMMMPQNQPVLTDFGVAKILGGQQYTATGAVVGTPAYMSPEQVRGETLDGRADIYSLGIMLYEMAAGHPPFEGDSAMTVMMKHVNDPVPDIRRLVQDAPPSFTALVDKALSKQPVDRFQTAAELAMALRLAARQLAGEDAPAKATVAKPPVRQDLTEPAPAVAPLPPPDMGATLLEPTARQPVKGTQQMRPPRPVEPSATVLDSAPDRPRPVQRPSPPPVPPPAAPEKRDRRLPPWLWVGAAAVILLLCLAVGAAAAVIITQTNLLGGSSTPTLAATAAPTEAGGPTAAPTKVVATAPPAQTLGPEASATTEPTVEPTIEVTPSPTAIIVPPGMVLVPGGTFNMGAGQSGDTSPIHPVTLDSFFMDQFEVTNDRYGQCVAAGVCAPPTRRSTETRSNYFTDPTFAQFPMVNVTWGQAETYCEWDGRRLATEAEWEYAASGGDGRAFPWGDEFDPSLSAASQPDTVAVGSFPGGASPFGIQDMAGNAVEWVLDWYAPDFYANSPQASPIGPDEGTHKVLRGGGFGNTDPSLYLTTRRYNRFPQATDVDIGLRCAETVP